MVVLFLFSIYFIDSTFPLSLEVIVISRSSPMDDLGFVMENPSSAEAIKASHETLRIVARKAQRCFGSRFLNVGYVARCVEDNFLYRRNQFYLTKPKWYPVFEPDVATLSGVGDAAIKINQAIPEYFTKESLSDLTGIDHD